MPSRTGARAVFIVAGLLAGVQAQPGGPEPEGWLYWIQVQDTTPYDTVILRAPLDDFTAIETVVDLPGGAAGLAIDRSASKLWWADHEKIQRADLDGSNIETVLTTPDVRFVALDSSHHKVYWTSTQEVRRANMDGTAVEDVLVGLDEPMGIKLDVAGEKLYFVEFFGYPYAVWRANLDGSDLEALIGQPSTAYNPFGIALDVPSGVMFFTDGDQEGLYRAKMDGPSVPFNIIIDGLAHYFFDVALDVAAGKVYASEAYFGDGIWRSDYGGVEDEHVLPSGVVRWLAILAPYCGDGIVDPGEECDDGNIVPTDGCAPDCQDSAVVPALSIPGTLSLALLLSAASAARIRRRAEPRRSR